MAPTVLDMRVLQNSLRDGVFFGQYSDPAFANNTEVDLFAVRKEDFTKLLFQIKSDGGNVLTLNFYGSSDNDIEGTNKDRLDPPDYSAEEYTLLPNGTVSLLAASSSDSRIVTDNWTWILARASLPNTTPLDLVVNVRGE